MNVLSWIILGLAVGVFFFLFVFFKKQMEKEIEIKLSKLSQEALKANNEQFLVLAKEVLGSKEKEIQADFDARKQAVQNSVEGLEKQLKEYKDLMRKFEEDRTQKYGNLENELKNTSQMTSKLQDTTNRLTNILGNVKLRGQWGERMAEDIIKGCGLIENVNYKKQTKLDAATTKPDYTFLLPDNHKINMDVKFPLDNYLSMVNAEEPGQREGYKKEFLRNVSMRIKEIQNRSYINPGEDTLDFVLLFIPNEQVFGFIQENMPGLIDEALKQKVVLCSPFTLYAMLSVIRQAFENFRYEKATKEIVKMIELFSKSYGVFKERFGDLGVSIDKLGDQYDKIKATSFKELDTKIRRIDDYKKGNISSLENQGNIIDIPRDNPEV
ncbi:MAG TPA: DNA recombination protein RmuC [Candidatus Omnitrophota bacterium]|nr:DNA recombination protein RmuC [Candidatus Omnitrophota bacterium]HPD84328.1 DNA recombination protein RmuC [Candidatus Omnitrophota bacterium]HRZ03186.1 DNA recombination protein RmuC [Candidatus Omnitrophota bacterium]